MKQGTISTAALSILLVLSPVCIKASTPAPAVEPLLRQAEAVRSTNPSALASTLSQLDRLKDTATPAQLRQLRLHLGERFSHYLLGRFGIAGQQQRKAVKLGERGTGEECGLQRTST